MAAVRSPPRTPDVLKSRFKGNTHAAKRYSSTGQHQHSGHRAAEASAFGASAEQSRHSVPPVTKLPCPRIPAPQIECIKQRHIMGQSQREIARAEGRSRPIIARIVTSAEMQAFVQEMRERFYGLAPDALATIEFAL